MTTGNIFIQTQSNGNFNMPYVSSLTCGSDIIRVMMEMLKTSTGWQPWKSFKLLYRGQAIDLNTPLVLFGEPLDLSRSPDAGFCIFTPSKLRSQLKSAGQLATSEF
jgi:hypothetical protein